MNIRLFNKSTLKECIAKTTVPEMEEKLAIIKQRNDTYKSGVLQKKTETECEQSFNQQFFGQVLGYKFFPSSPFSVDPKGKNEVSGQKADAILGHFTTETENDNMSKVQVVVEVKDAKTQLDKPQKREGNLSPIQQGFKYKPQYITCKRVIVSNFYEIRLFKDNMLEYEIWNLEQLLDPNENYENFRIFYYLLCEDHLISKEGASVTEKLLSEVRTKQEEITKKFYQQYKELRKDLIRDMQKLNPSISVTTLVKKAQKIIDRLVFIHFCEDLGLLPEGKLRENVLRASEIEVSPWHIVKIYFKGVDTGSEKLGIPNGYNGGLFAQDAILDGLLVGDDICKKFVDLGNYDFSEQIGVNILGHIFEQSISDLEDLKANLLEEKGSNQAQGMKEQKRKKDGIFYTPEYIVDYIVRNSLGKYLEDKFNEISATEKDEYKLYTKYQKELNSVKVLDHACGSGAFLVRVFDYLMEEQNRVMKILSGGKTTTLFDFDDLAKDIMQNNIYGVDLNDESVEITKLSLWLKTAQKGKKLASLDNNIKCGNSLIDDPAITGDKAFKWEEEFSAIMNNGGFDVVVGNPPYVLSRDGRFDLDKDFFGKNYKLIYEKPNLYLLFIEKSEALIKTGGFLGFIVPNSWLGMDSGIKVRAYLLNNGNIYRLISLRGESFPGVNVETAIFVYQKDKLNENVGYMTIDDMLLDDSKLNFIKQEERLKNRNSIINVLSSNGLEIGILEKMKQQTLLSELYNVKVGLQAYEKGKGKPKQTESDVENHVFDYAYKFDDTTCPYLDGGDVNRYGNKWSGKWLRHGEWLSQPKELSQFSGERILIREITSPYPRVLNATLLDETFLNNKSIINILSKYPEFDLRYLLAILNSTLLSFYHSRLAVKGNRTLFPKVVIKDVQNYFIPKAEKEKQKALIEKTNAMLHLNKQFYEALNFVLKFFQQKYGIEKLSQKLEKFYEYDFSEFIKQLKIKKLGLEAEAELMVFFDKKKSEILAIKNEIDKTDKEIDNMVFDLYGLSEEERKVVLGG